VKCSLVQCPSASVALAEQEEKAVAASKWNHFSGTILACREAQKNSPAFYDRAERASLNF
jgi:hypothetical protein